MYQKKKKSYEATTLVLLHVPDDIERSYRNKLFFLKKRKRKKRTYNILTFHLLIVRAV